MSIIHPQQSNCNRPPAYPSNLTDWNSTDFGTDWLTVLYVRTSPNQKGQPNQAHYQAFQLTKASQLAGLTVAAVYSDLGTDSRSSLENRAGFKQAVKAARDLDCKLCFLDLSRIGRRQSILSQLEGFPVSFVSLLSLKLSESELQSRRKALQVDFARATGEQDLGGRPKKERSFADLYHILGRLGKDSFRQIGRDLGISHREVSRTLTDFGGLVYVNKLAQSGGGRKDDGTENGSSEGVNENGSSERLKATSPELDEWVE